MTVPATVLVLGADDWELWRDLRLRALLDSPEAFGATYEREQGFAEQWWRERLADPTAVSVVICRDGRPVGIGGGYRDVPGMLHVVSMWVDPACRGQRLGHRVLDALRGWADDRGLVLHLDVATGNLAARRSYERYGFVPTGGTRPLREGSTMLVERLLLSGTPGSR